MEDTNEYNLRELSVAEVGQVSGGLAMSDGGLAILGVGLGALAGPVALGAFAVGLGTTMLVGGTLAEEGYS